MNDHAPLPAFAFEQTRQPTTLTPPVPISEEAFHLAIQIAVDYTSSFAVDTFLVPAHTGISAFVRVNDRHFSMHAEAAVTHAELLRHVGGSPVWREMATQSFGRSS